MARYIDADKFLKQMIEKFKCIPLIGVTKYINGEEYFEGEHLDTIIKETPTADVEEVVRCKNCTHGHWNQETCHGRCVHYCDLTDLQIDKEHFCSYGERKDVK